VVGLHHTTDDPSDFVASGGTGELVQQAAALPAGPDGVSAAGVRYADRLVQLSLPDLGSSGFGVGWGQERSWSNGGGYAAGTAFGNGTALAQLPTLSQDSNGAIAVIGNGTTARFFDYSGGAYTERFSLQETLADNTAANEFVLTDTTGQQLHFYDFGSDVPAGRAGRFKSLADPDGNTTSVTPWTADGKPQEVQRSNTSGGTTVVESYLYAYRASPDPNAGRVSNVTLRRQVNGGAWATVRQAAYTPTAAPPPTAPTSVVGLTPRPAPAPPPRRGAGRSRRTSRRAGAAPGTGAATAAASGRPRRAAPGP
jgi:hypothetical protein